MAKKKSNDKENREENKNDKVESKKKEKKDDDEKGNIYDRMIKEDSDLTFEGLLEMEYGINLEDHQPLREKIPKTLEREVDALYKIEAEDHKEQLLHLEYQTKNNKEMVERVQEYNALIYRKYGIPIRHIVVYYGPEKKKMISELPEDAVFRGFELICINEIDSDKFLNSDKPELVILAPLGKYKKGQIDEVLNLMFSKLDELPKYAASPSRYINKLLMYSKLRNLDETITDKIKDMPLFTNEMIKDHALYKEGKEEGLEQGREREQALKDEAEKREQALKKEAEKKEQALKKEAEKKEQALKKEAEKKEQALKKEAEKKEQAIINFHTKGVDIKIIAESYSISQKRVKEIIADWEKRMSKK